MIHVPREQKFFSSFSIIIIMEMTSSKIDLWARHAYPLRGFAVYVLHLLFVISPNTGLQMLLTMNEVLK